MVKEKIEIPETKTTEVAVPEPKFTLETLQSNAYELFGISRAYFDGAVQGLLGEFTKAEMKKILTEWGNKKI